MKFHPKVSIIVPVYNGANYLDKAVQSALAQTYDNFEILIVNDGSSDHGKTAAIGKRLEGENPRKVRYFEKPNGGVASALNLGIREMVGDFFSWLSHDDIYHPDKLATQVNLLATVPESHRHSTIVYSDFDVIGADDTKKGIVSCLPHHSRENLDRSLYPVVNGLIHGCTLLIPVQRLRELSGFDESLKYTQDYELWIRLFPMCNVLYLPEVLISSRAHAEQDSRKISAKSLREEEEDALWIEKVRAVPREMRILFEGSEANFFGKLLTLLPEGRAIRAREYLLSAWQNRETAAQNSSPKKVSVIVVSNSKADDLDASLRSIDNQSHREFEVLVTDGNNFEDELRRAIESARGDFVAFLNSGDRFDSEKLSRQIEYMGSTQTPFICSAYAQAGANGELTKYILGPTREFKNENMFTLAPCFFSTLLAEKSALKKLMQMPLSGPSLLLARIARQNSVKSVNLPLTWVAPPFDRGSDIKLKEMELAEFYQWMCFNLLGTLRAFRQATADYLKIRVFERLPFWCQLKIRRLVSKA